MEDDTNKEVGTVPGEDGVHVYWTENQHPLHDNHLFFFIYISTSCRSPGAEITPRQMNIKNMNPFY